MDKLEIWDEGGFRYEIADPQPEPSPRRAWLSPDWTPPEPPKEPTRIMFGPDYLADLPVWGVSWKNPPFSRKLLQALVDWQETFDDHGTQIWPEEEWEAWRVEGERLLLLVRRELGSEVTIEVTF